MGGKYQSCTRCVMDTTDPDIFFDSNGVCNHCKRYEERAKKKLHYDEKGQKILVELIEEIRRKGKKNEYDCIIGVSGGVDSTMVAYHAKKKFGLRPLAVHLDNGWNSELSVNNIAKTINKLGIELYTHVLNWEEFKSLQLSFLKASVINAEIPTDHAITAILFQVAAEKKAPYIFGGSNLVTEGILPLSWVNDHRDWKLIKGINKNFENTKLNTFPHYNLFKMFYYIFVKRIKYIPILNFVKYNKEEAMALIQKELGWQYYGGKHYESIYTRFYQSYILPTKFGIDKRRAHFSALIMSGQISREQALEKLGMETYPTDLMREDKEYVAKKFCLTEKEFDEIMALPIKNFRDYPNSYSLFTKFSSLVRFAKKVATYN